jgi:hypothetical protein
MVHFGHRGKGSIDFAATLAERERERERERWSVAD